MLVTTESVVVPSGAGHQIRCLVLTPGAGTEPRPWPAVLAYSDIFQLTSSHLRVCQRLCGYGFVVVLPEVFARLGLPATAFDFERDRTLALESTERMELAWFDDDRRALIAWMQSQPSIDPTRILACGWCLGGHLAFRAATDPAVQATACFYATGLHDDTVGNAHGTAPSLAAAHDIHGPLLLVWGTRDPHIPEAGRAKIRRALDEAKVSAHVRLYDAEHAFMRDEGARYDPAATDRAFADMLELFAPLR